MRSCLRIIEKWKQILKEMARWNQRGLLYTPILLLRCLKLFSNVGFWPPFSNIEKCDLHQILGEVQSCHTALLYRIIEPIRHRIADKTATFREEKVLLLHDILSAHIQIYRTRLWIATSSTIFSRLSLVEFLFVSKREKLRYPCHGSLIGRSTEIVFRHRRGLPKSIQTVEMSWSFPG